MSIQSEIERITANVQESLQICADNGVEVADGANSDALPDAVAALAALIGGGGGDETISVTITGSGHSSYCYVTIGETKYTSAASNIEVVAGDAITLTVGTNTSAGKGTVRIDGVTVLTVTSSRNGYLWTVPDGITAITIRLNAASSAVVTGTITVTTS